MYTVTLCNHVQSAMKHAQEEIPYVCLILVLLESLLEPVFRDLLLFEPFVPELSYSCSSLLLQVVFSISESKLLSSFFISARLPIYINIIGVLSMYFVHVASNMYYYCIQLGTSCVLAGSLLNFDGLYLMLWETTYLHPSWLLWMAAFSSPIQPCSYIQPQHYWLECLTYSLGSRKNYFRRWNWQHRVYVGL